jgi:hypothetical protein
MRVCHSVGRPEKLQHIEPSDERLWQSRRGKTENESGYPVSESKSTWILCTVWRGDDTGFQLHAFVRASIQLFVVKRERVSLGRMDSMC